MIASSLQVQAVCRLCGIVKCRHPGAGWRQRGRRGAVRRAHRRRRCQHACGCTGCMRQGAHKAAAAQGQRMERAVCGGRTDGPVPGKDQPRGQRAVDSRQVAHNEPACAGSALGALGCDAEACAGAGCKTWRSAGACRLCAAQTGTLACQGTLSRPGCSAGAHWYWALPGEKSICERGERQQQDPLYRQRDSGPVEGRQRASVDMMV